MITVLEREINNVIVFTRISLRQLNYNAVGSIMGQIAATCTLEKRAWHRISSIFPHQGAALELGTFFSGLEVGSGKQRSNFLVKKIFVLVKSITMILISL